MLEATGRKLEGLLLYLVDQPGDAGAAKIDALLQTGEQGDYPPSLVVDYTQLLGAGGDQRAACGGRQRVVGGRDGGASHVIDLGLRLEDIEGLERETVSNSQKEWPGCNLLHNGATNVGGEECACRPWSTKASRSVKSKKPIGIGRDQRPAWERGRRSRASRRQRMPFLRSHVEPAKAFETVNWHIA